ncbi:MAG: hypothetical protein V1684_02785 [bacterium]
MNNNEQPKENVNLLPEDLRKTEEKEIKEARKNPKVVEIEMSDPKRGFTFNQDKPEKGPGFWSKIFSSSAKNNQGLKINPRGFEPTEIEDESEDNQAIKPAKKNPSSASWRSGWWSGLFTASEDKERQKLERLALAKVREEARRRQKEALKTAKLAARRQHQQKDRSIFEQKGRKEKEEQAHREKMRWLMAQKKKFGQSAQGGPGRENPIVLTPVVPSVAKPVALPDWPDGRPVKPAGWPPSAGKNQKIQLTAGQLAKGISASGLAVNLIPQELLRTKEFKFSSRLTTLAVMTATALLSVGLLYSIIVFYQLQIINEIKAIEAQSEALKIQIAGYESAKAKAVVYQRQLRSLESLLAGHFYWTRFFGLLADNTTPDVYYTSFAADSARGSVSLSAAAKSYEALAKQLVAFEQAKDFIAFTDISGATAKVNENGLVENVIFNLNLQLAPGVFLKNFESSN